MNILLSKTFAAFLLIEVLMTFSWAGNLLMAFPITFPLREQKAGPRIYDILYMWLRTILLEHTLRTFLLANTLGLAHNLSSLRRTQSWLRTLPDDARLSRTSENVQS